MQYCSYQITISPICRPPASAAWCGPHPPHPPRYASACQTKLNLFRRELACKNYPIQQLACLIFLHWPMLIWNRWNIGEKPRLGSCLKRYPVLLPVYTPFCPHRVMIPFWPDSETLTDSQLITEEQKTPDIHQIWPKNYQWSTVKHSYILHDCTECSHCHILFLHDCIECFDSHMLFLWHRVLFTFYSVIYSMLLFGLLTAKV